MSRLTRVTLVACASLFTLVAAACVPETGGGGTTPSPTTTTAPPTTTTPPAGAPSLVVTPYITGLATPWDIAFAPDGTMLFTERVGRIDAWIGGAKRVLATPSDVTPMSESGMMGLAVDPAFATNRRIYTCFISNAGGPTDIRIARWVVDPTWTSLGSRTDILTGFPVNQNGEMGRHGGCRLRFGPDTNLWVTVGDSATGSVPQDPHSLGGKVLRITTNGAGAAGNPGGALLPQIYTYGHRNPQGVAFRPSDGQAFSVEHGTGCDDEVNVLRSGANYGWDPGSTGSGYDESTSMTDLVRFPSATPAVWSSGCPTIAPSGATFLSGSQWGSWDGSLAVAVLKGSQLRIMKFSPTTNAFLGDTVTVTDKGRLRVAVLGPDGDLFIAQDANPGSILRVHPVLSP